MLAKEIAVIIAKPWRDCLERGPGLSGIIGVICRRRVGQVIRHFELEKIPIRVRHLESNGSIERYHCSVREEAFADRKFVDLY